MCVCVCVCDSGFSTLVIMNHFSCPGRAMGHACVSACPDNNFWFSYSVGQKSKPLYSVTLMMLVALNMQQRCYWYFDKFMTKFQ